MASAADPQALEVSLHYPFKDPMLLRQALTHKSYINEARQGDLADNERLEFLGDSVVNLMISEHLLRHYPDISEGELSKMRAKVVSERGLSQVARRLGLGRYLYLGKGEELSGGREKSSLQADALEAVLAAIYLDGGHEAAARVIEKIFEADMADFLAAGSSSDFKTTLQEYCQREFEVLPNYQVIHESGPAHARIFEVSLSIKDRVWAKGRGRSKKQAEQCAAREVLEKMK